MLVVNGIPEEIPPWLQHGEECLALHSDGKYYEARVQEVDGSGRVQVSFIGYEDSVVLEPSQTRALPPLERGWSGALDPQTGHRYYIHANSGTTTWQRPSTSAFLEQEAASEQQQEGGDHPDHSLSELSSDSSWEQLPAEGGDATEGSPHAHSSSSPPAGGWNGARPPPRHQFAGPQPQLLPPPGRAVVTRAPGRGDDRGGGGGDGDGDGDDGSGEPRRPLSVMESESDNEEAALEVPASCH